MDASDIAEARRLAALLADTPKHRNLGAPAMLHALAAELERLRAQVAPAGWKLVPLEATPEMCKAAVIFANGNAVYKNVAAEALKIEEGIYGEVYEAMLAAAPAQQAEPLPVIAEVYAPGHNPVSTTTRAVSAEAFQQPQSLTVGDGQFSDDAIRAGVRAFQSGHNGYDDLSDWRAFLRAAIEHAAPPNPVTRAVAHKENGGWTVRIGTYSIGRWCYRGERADREVEQHVNRINMELDGKRVAAFGCDNLARRITGAKCWTGWCGSNNCPVTFEDKKGDKS